MKKLGWIIVVLIILGILAFVFMRGGDDDANTGGTQNGAEETPSIEEYADIQTSDDVFDEIDNSLDYV